MATKSISSFLLHSRKLKSLIGAQQSPSLLPSFSFARSILSNTSPAVKTPASAVGSEETAKKKIDLVSCERNYDFVAEFDEETKYKMEAQPGVTVVLEDNHNDATNKVLTVQSVTPFSPHNWNHRLDDIFSYHHLSERNPKWRSDHWLVHIKEPDSRFVTEQQVVDYCIQMLSKVVGSEEKAKEKIYIVWCKMPFGFGAEIDEKTSNKLKALPNALTVLPDYAFDVKNKDGGALVLPQSSGLKSKKLQYFYYWLDKLLNEGIYEVQTCKEIEEIMESLLKKMGRL